VFRGVSTVNLDAKGRLAIPSRYRERITVLCKNALILTVSPLDRCLWLYPLTEWEVIEEKLKKLSDFDKQSRRTKQMMRGYATDCEPDSQGRILIPQAMREYSGINKQTLIFGQDNKFELWDEGGWKETHEEWLGQLGEAGENASETLRDLSL
jgi:MraZ protein